MSIQGTESELRMLLVRVAKVDAAHVGLDDDLPQTLGLDSLAGLRLLAAVEKRFSVRFPDDQLTSFRTLRQILDFIPLHRSENESCESD